MIVMGMSNWPPVVAKVLHAELISAMLHALPEGLPDDVPLVDDLVGGADLAVRLLRELSHLVHAAVGGNIARERVDGASIVNHDEDKWEVVLRG